MSDRTRCHQRPNYLNFGPIQSNLEPPPVISSAGGRLLSPARAEGELTHGTSVLLTPGGGNSLYVRYGPSGPILLYLIHFEF
jgi:hypothetical protein